MKTIDPLHFRDPQILDRICDLVTVVASDHAVRSAVDANHDDNRWWPTAIGDWRLRIVLAGWSTRISYNMVDHYRSVVDRVGDIGYEELIRQDDEELLSLIRPIGLPSSRIAYLRSAASYIERLESAGMDVWSRTANEFIVDFAERVEFAGFKVAQCAALYGRGYHCGVIPVDSGMVSKLAPCLGLRLPNSAASHEILRQLLESSADRDSLHYRQLIELNGYNVTLPDEVVPTWWLHLVLIYFKRIYCNRPSDRLCVARPVCTQVIDCHCDVAHSA